MNYEEKSEEFSQPEVAPDMGYEGGAGEFYDAAAILNSGQYEIYYSLQQEMPSEVREPDITKDELEYGKGQKLTPKQKQEKINKIQYLRSLLPSRPRPVPRPEVEHIPNFYLLKREEVDGETTFSVGGIRQWSDQGAEFLGREEVKTGNGFFWSQVPVTARHPNYSVTRENGTIIQTVMNDHPYQRFMETLSLEESRRVKRLAAKAPGRDVIDSLAGKVALEPKVAHLSRLAPNDLGMKELLSSALSRYPNLRPLDDTSIKLKTLAGQGMGFEAVKAAARLRAENTSKRLENELSKQKTNGIMDKVRRVFRPR